MSCTPTRRRVMQASRLDVAPAAERQDELLRDLLPLPRGVAAPSHLLDLAAGCLQVEQLIEARKTT